MHQVSRRVIHWGCNTEDQDLIIALQNQVDREHLRAVAISEELERFHAGAREMHTIQSVHRERRVQYIANLRLYEHHNGT